MSTTDELLEEMLEDVEEYATPVTDDDLQFWIDEHLRVISIPKNGVVAGVEGDKNVNKIKFGMNRYYHGFDMSTFSGRILYSNAKGNKNYYNTQICKQAGAPITFSWLVDADAEQYMGKTAFVVYLFKIQGSELRQKFYSTLATLKVLEGMEVDSAVPVEKQTDIIERMKEEISAYAEEVKKSLPVDYTAMTEQVSSLKEELKNYTTPEKSIEEKHLSDDLLSEIKQAGYIVGQDGNKYKITIDENGKIVPNRIYEIDTNGLLCDIQIINGAVVDTTGNVNTSGFAVTDDYFVGDSPMYGSTPECTNIINGQSLGSRTIVLLGDFDEATHVIFGNNDTMYGLRFGKNSTDYSCSFSTFSKILLPVQEFMKYGNTKYNIPLPLAYTRANISKDPLLMTDLHNVFFVMSVDVENSKYSVVFNEMMPGDLITIMPIIRR